MKIMDRVKINHNCHPMYWDVTGTIIGVDDDDEEGRIYQIEFDVPIKIEGYTTVGCEYFFPREVEEICMSPIDSTLYTNRLAAASMDIIPPFPVNTDEDREKANLYIKTAISGMLYMAARMVEEDKLRDFTEMNFLRVEMETLGWNQRLVITFERLDKAE